MAHEKLFHVGVKALIINAQQKVLLLKTVTIKDAEAHWDIPGGRIQEGQDMQATLRREVEEETGITDIRKVTFYSAAMANFEIPVADLGKVGLVLMIYTVAVPQDVPITLSNEHTAYTWCTKQQAANRLSYKYPKEFTTVLANGS